MKIILIILCMTLVHTTAYLKLPFSKNPAKSMTDPLLYESFIDKINKFHQNITNSHNDTSLSAYHIAMLLP